MMKKFGKGLMLLALAASMVFGFVACGGDDDEKEDTPTLTTFTQEGGTGTLKVYDLEKGKGDFEMTVDSTTSKGTWERGEGTAIKCTTSDGKEITGSITVDQDGTVTSVTVTISATESYKFVRNAEGEEEVQGALTGEWKAETYYPSSAPVKSLKIDAGTTLGNVTIEGGDSETFAAWRANNNDNPTSWAHLELGKNDKGCLKFEIGATSTVVVEAASTGGSNTSDIVLTTKDDTEGAVTGSAKTVTGSSYTSVTYQSVPAGTYYLGAFPASDNNRGVRIKSITVTAN